MTKFSNYREIGTRPTVDARDKSVLSQAKFRSIANPTAAVSFPFLGFYLRNYPAHIHTHTHTSRDRANRRFFTWIHLSTRRRAAFYTIRRSLGITGRIFRVSIARTCALHTEIENDEARTPHAITPCLPPSITLCAPRVLRYSDFTPALCLSRQKNITGREVNRRCTYVLH